MYRRQAESSIRSFRLLPSNSAGWLPPPISCGTSLPSFSTDWSRTIAEFLLFTTKYGSAPIRASPAIAQPMSMPAFAPVDIPELDSGVEEAEPAVLLGELEIVFGEAEFGVENVGDETGLLEVVLVKEEVDIVAPDEPRVTMSVLNCTWNRQMPESQHPLVWSQSRGCYVSCSGNLWGSFHLCPHLQSQLVVVTLRNFWRD